MIFEQFDDGERHPSRDECTTFFEGVVAILNRVDDRGVRAGATDAAFFERFGEGGFAVSTRRLRVVLFRIHADAFQHFADHDAGEHGFLIGEFGIRRVAAFDVRSQVAGEVDRFAADLERAAFAFDRDHDAAAAGVGHLAGDRALPDHVEDFEFICVQGILHRAGQLERMAGGTNRFVRFLRVFDFAFVHAGFGRQVVVAIFLGYESAGVFDRDLR